MTPAKNQRIRELVDYLQGKYGSDTLLVEDHWEDAADAIGFAEVSGKHLVYVSADPDSNDYFVALENPPIDPELPDSDGEDYEGLGLDELERVLIGHLGLRR